MTKEVRLPEISENVDAGTVVQFMVAEGDTIEEDQPIVELETDKAAVEIPSDTAGVVREIKHSEGDQIEVGEVILTVETEEAGGGDRAEPEGAAESGAAESGAAESGAAESGAAESRAAAPDGPERERKPAHGEEAAEEREAGAAEAKEAAEEREAGAAEAKEAAGAEAGEPERKPSRRQQEREARAPDDRGRRNRDHERVLVPAAPSTRRLARELGADIRDVPGSGPEGRILPADVKAFTKKRMSEARGPGGTGYELPDFSRWGTTRREPMSQVRRITAENTVQSWTSVPHVTQFEDADVTGIEEFRHRYAKLAEKRDVKLTITAVITKIVGEALARFPRFNASLDMAAREVVYKDYIHISVAVDTDRGLLVPVIRDVDKKSILKVAGELADLAERARSKKIKPDEMEGGNFSISNLGGIGGTHFTPVIFPPQVAILGVGRAKEEPVYSDGTLEPRLIAPLALSYDHRIIDGADGARFMRFIAQALESPLALWLEGGEENGGSNE